VPPSSDWAVGIVSAIEAVRDGHRVTVIEALGFEPELWSDLRRRRASAFNLGERSEPEKAEAKPNPRANKFSPARMLFVGPNSRQTRAEFPPIEALAAPEVRIHPAPPTSPSPFRIGPEMIEMRAPAAYFARLVAAESATNLANRQFRPHLSLF